MSESSSYLTAASTYLASLGASGLEPAVRAEMVNMADLAAGLLLAEWLDTLQTGAPNAAELVERLGDLGVALQREAQRGEGESLLRVVHASQDHILFEGLLGLGLAAVKYAHWLARQAGRGLDDGYLDEALRALVRQAHARYLQLSDDEQAAYRAGLTPHRFAAPLLEEIRAQAAEQGLDLAVVTHSERDQGEQPAPPVAGADPGATSAALTPDQFLALLRENDTPPERVADILVDAFRPLLARNARPQYQQFGRGAVTIDLRGPEIQLMFVPQPALQAQATQSDAYRAIAALTTSYDPLREFIAVVLQPEAVYYYQLSYGGE